MKSIAEPNWMEHLNCEPTQFKLFAEAIDNISNKQKRIMANTGLRLKPTMVELGAGTGHNICLEVRPSNCDIIRQIIPDATVYEGYIGERIHLRETVYDDMSTTKISLKNIFEENYLSYVDILHLDIQGGEVTVLQEIQQHNLFNKIQYMFISTHQIPVQQGANEHILHRTIEGQNMSKEGVALFKGCQGNTWNACRSILRSFPVEYEWLYDSSDENIKKDNNEDGLIVVKLKQ